MDTRHLKFWESGYTHTYGGSNEEKARYGALARKTGKRLWMSETGADTLDSVGFDGTTLLLNLPAQSITTMVIPVEAQ